MAGIDDQFEADLASVGNLAKENDGVRFLLFVIDDFTKFLWVKGLKTKTAKSVLAAMKEVFKDRKPKKLRTDRGSEFVNQWFKKYMRDNDVYFFTTNNVPKASIVERSQRTFKALMYRMMRNKRTYRYIDDLDKLTANYNLTPHRSLGYLTPESINKRNEANVWAFMYLKPSKKSKTAPKTSRGKQKFKKGQFVRVSFQKRPFDKSYDEQFSTEIFKIKSIKWLQNIPMYSIEDLQGDTIKGRFYNSELISVDKNIESVWFLEKILKKKKT